MDGQHTIKELVIAYYDNTASWRCRDGRVVRLLRDQQFLVDRPLDAYAGLGHVWRVLGSGCRRPKPS